MRLARFVGYVDPEPPDPVRRVTIEYCLTAVGRPVALLDEELALPAPEGGWALTVGGGGLFGEDAEWELWDDAGTHIKTFRGEEIPLRFASQEGQLKLGLAIDPEVAPLLTVEPGPHCLRPLQPKHIGLLRR